MHRRVRDQDADAAARTVRTDQRQMVRASLNLTMADLNGRAAADTRSETFAERELTAMHMAALLAETLPERADEDDTELT